MKKISKRQPQRSLAKAMIVTLCILPSAVTSAEVRWNKEDCVRFAHQNDAEKCTLEAVISFAPLTGEPSQLIAEQAVKRCAWEWQYVYDFQKSHFPSVFPDDHYNGTFEQYMKSWAAEFTLPLVLESRLPAGSKKLDTDIEISGISATTERLLKSCQASH